MLFRSEKNEDDKTVVLHEKSHTEYILNLQRQKYKESKDTQRHVQDVIQRKKVAAQAKGVHKESLPGESEAGIKSRTADVKGAKLLHQQTLKDLKTMPKPNLTRAESPNENEIGTNVKKEKAIKKNDMEENEIGTNINKEKAVRKSVVNEPGFSDEFCDCE